MRVVLLEAVGEGLVAWGGDGFLLLGGIGHRDACVAGGEGFDEQRTVVLLDGGIEGGLHRGCRKGQEVVAPVEGGLLGHDGRLVVGGGVVGQHHDAPDVGIGDVDRCRAAGRQVPAVGGVHGVDGKLLLHDGVVHILFEHVFLARRGGACNQYGL